MEKPERFVTGKMVSIIRDASAPKSALIVRFGSGCTEHVPVDTGMGKSWCRKCDQKLAFVGLQWVEDKR